MKKHAFKLFVWLLVLSMSISHMAVFALAAPADDPESLIVGTVYAEGEALYDENGDPASRTADRSSRVAACADLSSYDARDYGCVTPVKNQLNGNNTCWAFATMSALESQLIRAGRGTASTLDLSEDHLVWFVNRTAAEQGDGVSSYASSDHAYKGIGSFVRACPALANWWGVELEKNAAYPNGNYAESLRASSYYHLTEYNVLASQNSDILPHKDEIKAAVMDKGAVAAYYREDAAYHGGTNGVSYYMNNAANTTANHAVTIIGWDDDYPKESFKSTPPGNGAFLIKNSYGPQKYDQGYMWISYYDLSLSNAGTFACIPASTDVYDNVYSYNGYGPVNMLSNNMTGLQYANAFVAPQAETLGAVGLWTMQDDVHYTIKVYRNLSASASDPTSGTPVSSCTTSGDMQHEGYHIVPLKGSVRLQTGERYAVVVSITLNSGTTFIYPFELFGKQETYRSGETNLERTITYHSDRGESFLYLNNKWRDVKDTTGYELNNALLNVYTCKNKSDYSYTLNAQNKAVITGYTGSQTTLTIPSAIDGYTVTEIGDNAFRTNTKLQSVAFPSTVQAIGANAFSGCTALRSVTLPASLKTIDAAAFATCTALTSVSIPAGVTTIGRQAFSDCTALATVQLNNGTTTLTLNEFAFLNCTSLKTIDIASSNIVIGADALGYTYDYYDPSHPYGSTGLTIRGYTGSPAYAYYLANKDTVQWEPLAALSSIAVTKQPTKTSYKVGDTLDATGMIVTATYTDGTKAVVTSKAACSPTTLQTAGTQTITVTYKEGSVTKTTSFTVTVVGLSSIAVTKQPTKTSYKVGDTLDATGMIVTATYTDGTKAVVTSKAACSPTTLQTAGTQTVTVTYKEGSVTKTATFTVTVIGRYTITWVVDGSSSTVSLNAGDPIVKPTDPTKEGYTFKGWSPDVPAVMPAQNLTFTAQFEVNRSAIVIHNHQSSITVDYHTTIHFSADVFGTVPGAQIHWFVNNQDVGTGRTLTVREAETLLIVQAKYIKDGSVLAESAMEAVFVNNGFFARLIAFFRSLFGRLPVITQEYLGMEIIR